VSTICRLPSRAATLNISRERLLPAPAGVGSRPHAHAADCRAAFGVPLRRKSAVARPAGCRGEQIGRQHVTNADEADGDRGALSSSPHDQATKPIPGHKIYPYLLRDAAITRPNQVWAMDFTYMARGFVYLAVVLDWFSLAGSCDRAPQAGETAARASALRAYRLLRRAAWRYYRICAGNDQLAQCAVNNWAASFR
jgi:transposase InsO family protein